MMRVADYVIERLYAEGCKHIFMVTGRGALFLTDAVARHKATHSISVHHEQAAAYASVAYADYSEQPSVCLVSTGCAATNTITGVLSAWQDGIPCVFISGQNMLQETTHYTGIALRTYGQQEADIIPIVTSITKYATMISDPKKIKYALEKALYLAQTGRKGPVWIDIPLDVQSMHIEPDELESFVPEPVYFQPIAEDIQYLRQAIQQAERPVILIGSSIRSADAIDELHRFIEQYQIPLVYSASAVDSYGTDNLLSIGSVGIMGCTRAGNFALQNSDLLLVLGCRLSSMTTGTEYCKFARSAKVIVVDIDSVEHSKKSIKIDRLIIADIKHLLNELMTITIKSESAQMQWIKKCLHWKQLFSISDVHIINKHLDEERVDLYHLAASFSEILPLESVFLTDSGLNELILPTNICFKEGMRCIHPVSQGAMGFALPAIIGAYYASHLPVIAVIGDGSIMMNLQELKTIQYLKIPAKIFVINNNAYAVIRKRQVKLFRSRTIGTDADNGIECSDFKKIASGFEISYVKILNSADLASNLKFVIAMDGPVLCEIMGLENQDYINVSHARNSEGQYVQRPLEDQSPFLDRELFQSEMIIEPIDQ
ncbi:thiamine pyrophosphate-binding protein [sulfur-oxidizing endosymbiont of Gigantopelta aegis]|uniref:thiamine pyrophosphate-binding protein n=1 Tax=sulfur-oxidizing endosymbiont of Gigantopelta aegis TaxID=2794934 RepID=UPI0018DE2726|nr:thiamine pyrophosphate-binding protein [sulfur-oxidizing endosymbiont of Gigantopelta aegis]